MKEISALIKGPPRDLSLHLPWEDPVRKSQAEAHQAGIQPPDHEE